MENDHQHVSEKDFKIVGNGSQSIKKKKNSWGITTLRNQTKSEDSRLVSTIAVTHFIASMEYHKLFYDFS